VVDIILEMSEGGLERIFVQNRRIPQSFLSDDSDSGEELFWIKEFPLDMVRSRKLVEGTFGVVLGWWRGRHV
jgi:hypothetical protein